MKPNPKGKLRLEGKEYLVKDGDIVHIRFKFMENAGWDTAASVEWRNLYQDPARARPARIM